VAYGPLAQGLLTGKFAETQTFGEDDRRARLPHFSEVGRLASAPVVAAVREVARATGHTPAQVALRWVLDQPGVVCAIVGATRPAQIEDNAGACGWQMTREYLDKLEF
jgi:aryl-alcohol dehydrogenase-like predicted oxidoreductase